MSKRLWMVLSLAVLLSAAASGLGQAIPSLGGPTGLVALPTAEIAPQDFLDVVLTRQSIESGSNDLTNWELKALGAVSDRAELWTAYSTLRDDVDSHLWGLGGKIQLTREPEDDATLAVGAGWLNWADGLLSWMTDLPVRTRAEWADSTPADMRDDIRDLIGLPSAAVHTVTVTASCTPTIVGPGGSTACSATAVDSLGHEIESWCWSDGDAGGTFSDETAQNPIYTAPTTEGDVTLTATATCSEGLDGSGSTVVTVSATAEHTLTVSITTCEPTEVPWEGGTISLEAQAIDNFGAPVASWEWAAVPADAGNFSAPAAAITQFIVAAQGMYNPDTGLMDPTTLTATATSSHTDALQASAQCIVTQMYGGGAGAGVLAALGDGRVSLGLTGESAAQAMARLKQTLRSPSVVPAKASEFNITAENRDLFEYLKDQDVKVWNAYLVATKDFTPMDEGTSEWGPGAGTRMLGTAGIYYLKADPDLGKGFSLTRPFLGMEFLGAGGTALALEYRWKDSDLDNKALFSAVLTAELGSTNSSPIGLGLDDQDWFVRVGYTIPLKQAAW